MSTRYTFRKNPRQEENTSIIQPPIQPITDPTCNIGNNTTNVKSLNVFNMTFGVRFLSKIWTTLIYDVNDTNNKKIVRKNNSTNIGWLYPFQTPESFNSSIFFTKTGLDGSNETGTSVIVSDITNIADFNYFLNNAFPQDPNLLSNFIPIPVNSFIKSFFWKTDDNFSFKITLSKRPVNTEGLNNYRENIYDIQKDPDYPNIVYDHDNPDGKYYIDVAQFQITNGKGGNMNIYPPITFNAGDLIGIKISNIVINNEVENDKRGYPDNILSDSTFFYFTFEEDCGNKNEFIGNAAQRIW